MVRLVAQGFSQKEGIDYDEIFSPMANHASIWVLVYLVAHLDIKLRQLGVKMTFFHRDLEDTIYVA